MPISYTSDGFYIVQVDTGIGEQYACIQVTKPPGVLAAWNPIDGLSGHYKALVGGPGVTPEAAWAAWRASLPVGHAFGAI